MPALRFLVDAGKMLLVLRLACPQSSVPHVGHGFARAWAHVLSLRAFNFTGPLILGVVWVPARGAGRAAREVQGKTRGENYACR
jgi:hypothetical protein